MTSVRPSTPAGMLAFSDGRPNSGMAQEPGLITWPSVSDTLGGRPLTRTKLLLGSASRGPI